MSNVHYVGKSRGKNRMGLERKEEPRSIDTEILSYKKDKELAHEVAVVTSSNTYPAPS